MKDLKTTGVIFITVGLISLMIKYDDIAANVSVVIIVLLIFIACYMGIRSYFDNGNN